MDGITNKESQNKSFLPFNFAITKICVAIRLAGDGARMSYKEFQLSPSSKNILKLLTSIRI